MNKNERQEIDRYAYIAKLKNESFHDGIANGLLKEMSKLKVQVDIFPGQSQQDIETQIQKIREIAQNKSYKGVLISPNDSTILIPHVQTLDDNHIPFLFVDTPLVKTEVTENFNYDCGYVGTNNILAGNLAAKFVMNKMDAGNIFMMRGNHKHQSSIDRETGFLDIVTQSTQYKTIGYTEGYWEEEKAYLAFKNYIASNHSNIDAVFAYSDPMALGVSRYYREKPHLQRPIIVGVDGTLVGQRGVLENKIDATVVQAPEVMAKMSLNNLINCISANSFEKKQVLTPVTLYTSTVVLERASLHE